MTAEGLPPDDRPGYAFDGTQASREWVAQTRAWLDSIGADINLAEKFADWMAFHVEAVGGSDARPVFVAEVDPGLGPVCSWCWRLWGMCRHHATTEVWPPERTDPRAA
ncbi:MAG TPA: hypothetical protein VIQ30_22745 [Pseudonocardia sp.]